MTTVDYDQELAAQLERLRGLYVQVGEDQEVGERAISGMLVEPGALDRVRATADTVAALWNIQE